MPKKLIIAAQSARTYAQAAVACGYEVIALDAFIDADVQAIATQALKLKIVKNGLDEAYFKDVFSQLDLTNVTGFLYGSVFDNCSDILAWVAHQIRLIGNAPEVLKQAKDYSFFKLLDDLEIAHPEVSLTKPNDAEHWLSKQIGGAGGLHIKPANCAHNGDYFQRKVVGVPMSMLFVADGKAAQLVGFNRQFVSPTAELPYRFAGAVSNAALQANIHAAFEHAAQALTSALNLCGLNNLDAILGEDGKLWMLELNPRLSASFNLYENLMRQHLSGCAGSLAEFGTQNKQSKAQLILYANSSIQISTDFIWPSWAADIPESDVKISAAAPICSVFAEAETAELAENLVRKRAEMLKEMLIK